MDYEAIILAISVVVVFVGFVGYVYATKMYVEDDEYGYEDE